MCPQFVDFDADGYTDFIAATFEGTIFIVRGSAEGWSQPEHLKDSKGRNLVLSLFYDTENNKYDNADRSPEGVANAEDHCVSAMVMDWDNDGDYDMLLGAKKGRLYLQRNEGEAGTPKFTGVNELLEAGGKPFNVPGGLTAPREVDWDNDGVNDLICGSFTGGVYFYRNAGKLGAPNFEAPVTLVEAKKNTTEGPHHPTSGVYADPVDYDGDGDLDLLVGGYAEWQPATRKLTEAEEARVVELREAIAEVDTAMSEIYLSADKAMENAKTPEEEQAVWQRIMDSDDYQKLSTRNRDLDAELGDLVPSKKRQPGIWLYRRQ